MRRGAYACFGVALALVIITYGITIPQVQKSLQHIDAWFRSLELFIAQYESVPAFLLLMALFLLKSYIPVIPFSVLFVASGMVFNEYLAFIINILGISLLCVAKFYVGKRKGGGSAYKIVNRSKTVYKFMDFGGKGNKWMLALMRFMPVFPVNTVSRAYGGTDMKVGEYLGFSLLGFLPRLVLWSWIGINIFNPFTVTFMAPIIILLIISGISLLLLNVILERKDTENEKN